MNLEHCMTKLKEQKRRTSSERQSLYFNQNKDQCKHDAILALNGNLRLKIITIFNVLRTVVVIVVQSK